MSEESAADPRHMEPLRTWRGRIIGDREAQHMRELLRREAAGEFSAAELSEELRRLVLHLGSREPRES